ncbi:pyruvate kinase [Lentisphaerota bacterium ZTH]|nr:pyruvate kinase [Lentisphaerota bacterium]WET06152.1 pyruvate kinase [Lentisphaerota bacterium ZTH]
MKTKIIATVGPACESAAMIEKMIKAGVNVFRLNFSFGTHEEHRAKFNRIRKTARKLKTAIAIMQDLQGPKIRVGKLEKPVTVKSGSTLTLTGKSEHVQEYELPTTYPGIADDTAAGKRILMMDGQIVLKVKRVVPDKKQVICQVESGGTIQTGKGINLPYTKIAMPALTEKDRADAVFGAELGVDYMALSFVRSGKDLRDLKRLLKKQEKAGIPVIAKLEKPEALDNLEEILDVADGVMVARGDLADEISFAKVPVAQKRIISRANSKGKLTIVATEMLSSMVHNPLPTRAEVSDVANSILDGTDLIMLSNETAVGYNPPNAVKAMRNIADEAEQIAVTEQYLMDIALNHNLEVSHAMCLAASMLSHELNEEAVAVITTDGENARILAKYRPECKIFAATHVKETYYRMAAFNNVTPLLLDGPQPKKQQDAHKSLEILGKLLIELKVVRPGQRFICLTGISADDESWRLNSLHTVEIPRKKQLPEAIN